MKEYPAIIHNDLSCSVWFKFEIDEGDDLCPVLLSELPEADENCEPNKNSEYFLKYEIDMGGVESVLDVECSYINYENGVGCDQKFMQFALENGIAPYQPFRVKIEAKYSSGWTDCGMEYDSSFYYEILQIEPMDEKDKLKNWEEYLCAFNEYRQYMTERNVRRKIAREELESKRRVDFSAMFVEYEPYYNSKDNYYDGWGKQSGLIMKLCSEHTGTEEFSFLCNKEIFSLRREDGNRELLRKEMREKIEKEFQELKLTSYPWIDYLLKLPFERLNSEEKIGYFAFFGFGLELE